MANKFTQSVLERNRQEAAPARQERPEGPSLLDLAAETTPVRSARNKTYYLDEAVIQGVHAAARQRKMADSRLVNALLRQILGLNEED